MKERYRISGKKVELPAAAPLGKDGGWKLTPRPGGWIVAEGPQGQRRRIAVSEVRGKLGVSLGGTLWQGEVAKDERAGAGAGAGSDADLVAQFPGKVRKILVTEGAKVAEGEPLMLLEAMKMEFAIKAPYAGRVRKIPVKEAQQLSPGDRLIELEPEAAKS